MSQLPLVSVITPSYNQGRFIEQTIQSVLSQDYPHIEYLVIDGGSTDNTLDVLRKYETRLTWVSEPDEGQTAAINKGFKRAQGDIVCWLNSDDTYEPGAVRTAVEFLCAHPDVMMVYGEGNEIDENGALRHRFPATQEFDLWALIYIWDYILQPTTFFRKQIFDTIELPDVGLRWCMDWDLWMRIGGRFKVAYVDYVFANSRLYPETKTASGGMKRLREIAAAMRKYGMRRYPLGYFLFAEDTVEVMCMQKFPVVYMLLKAVFYWAKMTLDEIRKTYQGVYGDNWLGKKARFMFSAHENLRTIKYDVELPQNPKLFPNTLTVKVNGDKAAAYHLTDPGRFEFEIPVSSPNRSPTEVELTFAKALKPKNDNRKLSCFLHNIELLSR